MVASSRTPTQGTAATLRGRTFDRWLEVETWRQPALKDVKPALAQMAGCCRQIAGLVRNAHINGLTGLAGQDDGAASVNIQGEEQKKLDIVTNDLLKTWLCASGTLYCVASEEEDEPCTCSNVIDHPDFNGDLVAMFDPLDGSSNVDAGLATGTIFGILRHPEHLASKFGPSKDSGGFAYTTGGASPDTLLQKGSRLVAAGYCLYGAATTLVVSLGTGVHGFTLDPKTKTFVLTMPDIRIPRRGRAVMFNHGNFNGWDVGVQQYVRDAQEATTKGRAERHFAEQLMAQQQQQQQQQMEMQQGEEEGKKGKGEEQQGLRGEAGGSAGSRDDDGGWGVLLAALEEQKLAAAAREDYERAALLKRRIADTQLAMLQQQQQQEQEAEEEGGGGEGEPSSSSSSSSSSSRRSGVSGSSPHPRRYFKYSGAFVADVHSLLTKGGGLFGYPADDRNKEGKLRLLYEANPMAFLVEQAGGVASTGLERILDVPPNKVHQRVPTFMGSADDVYELSSYMRYRLGPDMWI